MDLGVRAQDPLPQTAGSTMDDKHEIAAGQPEPLRLIRLEDGIDARQLDEVVAPAHGAQALDVAGGDLTVHQVGVGIQGPVQIGEPGGQLGGFGLLGADREHRDAAADVRADQERVQHGRCHRGADRGALAGVQVRQAGDVDHAGQRRHLVALSDGIGFDPTAGREEDGDAGRRRWRRR